MGLDWQRFIIAETEENIFAGCGQLKTHSHGVLELASIAVVPKYQGQGLGKIIITYLLKQAPRPLYLTCRDKLGSYYQQFGFRVVENDNELPSYFLRLRKLAGLIFSLKLVDAKMLVMVIEK